jgi:hypothetical protein
MPVHRREQEYIDQEQDLVTLRRSQDPDLVNRMVEWCLYKLPHGRFVEVRCFCGTKQPRNPAHRLILVRNYSQHPSVEPST